LEQRPQRLREEKHLEHLHWVGCRRGDYPELTVLAIDHRTQFETLARSCGADQSCIEQFKSLAVRATHKLAKGDARFGVLLDGRHAMRALEAAADLPYWIGRPIELPQSCPIEFDAELNDVGAEIASWPLNHTVKALFLYHPDDPVDLRERQERQALRLFDACRATRHELLVEIIASKNGAVDSKTAARAIQRFYDLGIFPDWWKLEPAADAETWANIERVIVSNDPHCRGVVLLGLSSPLDELVQSFAPAARVDLVKGFAVGRTIFNDAASRWFKGEIDDEQAVEALSSNLGQLVEAWRRARKARTR